MARALTAVGVAVGNGNCCWSLHHNSANGALTSLNVSNNNLGGYWKANPETGENDWISDMTGVKALASAIPECK